MLLLFVKAQLMLMLLAGLLISTAAQRYLYLIGVKESELAPHPFPQLKASLSVPTKLLIIDRTRVTDIVSRHQNEMNCSCMTL